jgi:outer membrane protein OmpA-like peptidoglycan-associated protein
VVATTLAWSTGLRDAALSSTLRAEAASIRCRNNKNRHGEHLKYTLSPLAALLVSAVLLGCATAPPPPPTVVAPPPPPPAPMVKPAVVLPISQLDRGVQIVLPDTVLFESGKAALNLSASAPYLDRLAVLLTTKTAKQIAVEGHTDSVGAPALNQKLSEQRADAVANALISRGVPTARVSKRGMSFSQPAAPNDVEAGRRLNRRTEIIILDETVASLTQGEAANSFEDAAARVKAALEAGAGKP